MPIISKDNKCVTFINVFTVEPSNQKKLIELLIQATETSVRHVQGFISASFHRSFDGTKVTAYAQWRSAEDYQAMRKNPVALPYMEQALALATFDSGMYEVFCVTPHRISRQTKHYSNHENIRFGHLPSSRTTSYYCEWSVAD
jgi:quinol monooxygenase YgiN